MQISELKLLFKDLQRRMDSVATIGPDTQRLEYQTIAANALQVIKQVIDTGLTEQQQNCPYCHSEKPIMTVLDDEIQIYIANSLDSQLLTTVFDFSPESVADEIFMKAPFGAKKRAINYCPMCGRSLNEEGD